MQFIRQVRGLAPGERPPRKSFRIALLVAAWDAVDHAWQARGAGDYLGENLPLLEDFLWSNFHREDVYRFGLSSTGGDLNGSRYRQQYNDDDAPGGFVTWTDATGQQVRASNLSILALQERAIDGRPFDFLGLPPEAQGAFHSRAASMAWWRQGRLGHPGLTALPIIDWLAEDGPTRLHALLEQCRTANLPMPAPASDLPALRKLFQVPPAAPERLTAARARADLLVRLWPSLASEHAEWRDTLDALITLQLQAALEPRPLWDLISLTTRPQLWIAMAADPDELATVFARAPGLAWELAVLALREPAAVNSELLRAALSALPTAELWTPANRAMLESAAEAAAVRAWIELIGPRLLCDAATGLLTPDECAAWLRMPVVGAWLQRSDRWTLERILARPGQEWLHAITEAVFLALPEDGAAPTWLLQPVIVLLRSASRASLDRAATGMLSLLAHPACSAALQLHAEVLVAVNRIRAATSPELLAEVFHHVYSAVLADRSELHMWSWRFWDWDRGKALRHWLLDTWVSERWPPVLLVRCLGSNEELARSVFKRAIKKHPRAFVHAMDQALGDEPALYRVWRSVLAE